MRNITEVIKITKITNYINKKKYNLLNFFVKIKSDTSVKNRFFMISLASLFFIDYLLFCFISDKNPLNIFPSFPLLEDKKPLYIYFPDSEGSGIIKETRNISVPDDREGYIHLLIENVISAWNIENTSSNIPADTFIRKIWFYQDICIIDFLPSLIEETSSKVIPGSEKMFKESLEKTITENIPSINKILFLEIGIPGRTIWE